MLKIKLDVSNKCLELEGEDKLVQDIYRDFIEFLKSCDLNGKNKELDTLPENDGSSGQSESKKLGAKNVPKIRESFSIVPNLDLGPGEGREGLKSFFERKKPSSAQEKNTVFVYYLKKNLNWEKVGLNEIYTCYKNIQIKVPKALRQSLADTSHRKGWINTNDINDINLNVHGENFIEHDLPPQKNN